MIMILEEMSKVFLMSNSERERERERDVNSSIQEHTAVIMNANTCRLQYNAI